MSFQIGLCPDPRDLDRNVEERVRDLAGDHVDLVVEGHGNDHVCLLRARGRQRVGCEP